MSGSKPPNNITGEARADGGLFITFEGGDGVGKSTQTKRLADALREMGCVVTLTREPGGAAGAEAIRDLIVSGPVDRWTPMSEALMMYAARAEHLDKTIRPALARGEVVLCDRFTDSTLAYQGYAGGVDFKTLGTLYDLVVGADGPDLTFMLTLDAQLGLARAKPGEKGEHRFEDKGADFQTKVTAAFADIAANNPERCVVIDASQEKDKVTARLITALKERFSDRLASLADNSGENNL